MDEVRAERLIEGYENSGCKLSETPLLVMLKRWTVGRKYRQSPSLRAALEHLVSDDYNVK